MCVCIRVARLARATKILLILPTVLVPSGGTKIVLCLLPRLQHWQHDVAIYSQYCISMAFCEKVAANLSPQSAACQCEEESSRGTGWGELGQLCPSTLHPGPLISAPPPPVATPELLFSRRAPLCLQIKAVAPASVWWVKIRVISMQARVSLSFFAGMWWLEEERKVEWQLDGRHNKTVIERYVIMAISGWSKWYQRDISV